MPPSIHPTTTQPYRWESGEPAITSHRLQELLTPRLPKPIYRPSSQAASGAGLLCRVATAQEGNRNKALFWAACRAREDGILDQIEDELITAAMSAGETETKARRTVASTRRTTS
jgi:hypothetical protein